MVASQHVHVAWVPQFVGEEKRDHFHVIGISIDVVTLEQVFFMWRWSNLVKESKKILKLSVCVSRNYYWRLHIYYYGFSLQNWDEQAKHVLHFCREQVSVLFFVQASDVADQLFQPSFLFDLILGFDEDQLLVGLLVLHNLTADSPVETSVVLVVSQWVVDLLVNVLARSIFIRIVGNTGLPIHLTILINGHYLKFELI